ncbi:MAG: DUF6527 family protein [Solirubrobacteraceae bacterium]|jgi:hypothetical protein
MRRTTITHEFVEFVPAEREGGVLYISTRYRVATHSCFCGCGRKVVTPLSPARWALIFDGDTASLVPSIGNWQSPCRSHYWIKRNHVKWAGQWSEAQIAAGRERDRLDLERYLSGSTTPSEPGVPLTSSQPSRLARLRRWLRGRRRNPDA